MLTKRIIACLDMDDGRVVKGVQFVNLRDAGDPAECAAAHARDGADEIVLLDITATSDNRRTMLDVVSRTARCLFIPFTVGGGIRELSDAEAVFEAGADKIAINSAAVKDSTLIGKIAARFGSQAVVVAIDAKRVNGGPEASRCSLPAGAFPQAGTRFYGRGKPRLAAREKSCSLRWTATGPKLVSIVS